MSSAQGKGEKGGNSRKILIAFPRTLNSDCAGGKMCTGRLHRAQNRPVHSPVS